MLGRGAAITIEPLHADGIYAVREKIEWRVESSGAEAALTDLRYVLERGQLTEIKSGTLDLSPPGGATIDTALDEPGTVLAVITGKDAGKPIKVLAGAVVAPEKIAPSAKPPEDFDSFWKDKLAELAAVPPSPQVELQRRVGSSKRLENLGRR